MDNLDAKTTAFRFGLDKHWKGQWYFMKHLKIICVTFKYVWPLFVAI